jgi:hypothetical protein
LEPVLQKMEPGGSEASESGWILVLEPDPTHLYFKVLLCLLYYLFIKANLYMLIILMIKIPETLAYDVLLRI